MTTLSSRYECTVYSVVSSVYIYGVYAMHIWNMYSVQYTMSSMCEVSLCMYIDYFGEFSV